MNYDDPAFTQFLHAVTFDEVRYDLIANATPLEIRLIGKAGT